MAVGRRPIVDVETEATTLRFPSRARGAAGKGWASRIGAGFLMAVLTLVVPISTALAFTGDGGPATSAPLDQPLNVAVDKVGDLFIADSGHSIVRKVDKKTGIITTVAGNGDIYGCAAPPCGDGGPATLASIGSPKGINFDKYGNLFIAANPVRFVCMQKKPCHLPAGAGGPTVQPGNITTVLGDEFNPTSGWGGDGGPADLAQTYTPWEVQLDSNGNLWMADYGAANVRFVCLQSTTCTVYPRAPHTCGPTGTSSCAITVASGDVQKVVAQSFNGAACNNGGGGGSGYRGFALNFCLQQPAGLAFDGLGHLYISDAGQYNVPTWAAGAISTVDLSTGIISLLALGEPPNTTTYSATDPLYQPYQIQWASGTDPVGFLYVTNWGWGAIDMLRLGRTPVWTDIAGNPPQGGYGGDGGPATSALLNTPAGVAVDKKGDIYIGDQFSNRVREVDAATGIITTVAGNGSPN